MQYCLWLFGCNKNLIGYVFGVYCDWMDEDEEDENENEENDE